MMPVGCDDMVDTHLLEMAERQAEICKIFANVNRILILWVLQDQDLSVGDIAEAIGSTLPNTSQHLRLMKDKEILVSRRDGQAVLYHIADHYLKENGLFLPYAVFDVSITDEYE